MSDKSESIMRDFLAKDFGIASIRDSESLTNPSRSPYILARTLDSGVSSLTVKNSVQRNMTLQLSIAYPAADMAERDAKAKAEQIFSTYKLGYRLPGEDATVVSKSIFSHAIDTGWVNVVARINFRFFYTET